MKQIPYCSLEQLQTVWENIEVPLIIHLDAPSINICRKSQSIFNEVAEIYSRKEVLFLSMALKGDQEIQAMVQEYGFLRFPAVFIYDYGTIQKRFNSTSEISSELDTTVKSLA